MMSRRRSLCESMRWEAVVMPQARRRLMGMRATTSTSPARNAMRTCCHRMTKARITCRGRVKSE